MASMLSNVCDDFGIKELDRWNMPYLVQEEKTSKSYP